MIPSQPSFAPERQVIQAYEAGGFKVSGARHRGSIIVLPERTLAFAATTQEGIDEGSLEPILAHEPRIEILLLGLGASFLPAPPALRQACRERGVALEAMTTPAACRTYNILLAEERRVAAALLALPAG